MRNVHLIQVFSCSLVAVLLPASLTQAEEFRFGSFENNGINNRASGQITEGAFTMSLAAGPAGALITEISSTGLGVNSRAVPGVEPIDDAGATGGTTDINLIGGSSQFAGQPETITFSFDKPGVVTEMDFSGVKDESYEHFILTWDSGPGIYFFDSFNGSSADPGLISVPGTLVFLLEEVGNSFIDDRSPPLFIPFEAGQEFTLSFGDLPLGDVANGARFQGITVVEIPEPATALLVAGLLSLWPGRLRR